jgi:proteic killer suppression protein
MDVASFRHKGLQRLFEEDDARGVKADQRRRLANIFTAIVAAPDIESLEGPPGWRIHELKGDRAGTWSISVSGNWRLTFRVENGSLVDVDLEDYH